ncbi:MAG: leucine-rich repeat protein, partial [Bacilli bacterium]|nr:leucine-rich repeat protein [Bacilli bacterium]
MRKIVILIMFLFIFVNLNVSIYAEDDESEEKVFDETQYIYEDFDEFLKTSNNFDENPSITFLVPGLSSDAKTWGIDQEMLLKTEIKDGEEIESYSEDGYSLLENSIVSYTLRRNSEVCILGFSDGNKVIDKDFHLNNIYAIKSIVRLKKTNLYGSSLKSYIRISFNKPCVVVINPINTSLGHNIFEDEGNEAYQELEALINGFIYQYMKQKGDGVNSKKPKINLVGHSRGGILNMMYALNHPDIVDTLVSIGTPYLGTSLANIKVADDTTNDSIDGHEHVYVNKVCECGAVEISNVDGSVGLLKYIMDLGEDNAQALFDCCNPEIFTKLKDEWNDAIDNGMKTKLVAIGSSMSLDLIGDIFNSLNINDYVDPIEIPDIGFLDEMKEKVIELGIEEFNNITNNFNNFIDSSYANIQNEGSYYDKLSVRSSEKRVHKYLSSSKVDNNLLDFIADALIEFLNSDEYVFDSCLYCTNGTCDCTDDELSIIKVLYYLFKHICENTYYDFTVQSENEYGDFIYEGDLFVDLDSQLATGYKNVIAYEKVFTKDYDLTKYLDDDNFRTGEIIYNYDKKDELYVDSEKKEEFINEVYNLTLSKAIGHNLERIDEDIIRCVLSNLYLGNNDNGLIINENNKIIGYNHEAITRNVSNGVLKIPGGYTISSKMFGIDKNSAQAKRDADFLDENEEFRLSHNIKEIRFLGETFIEDGAFTYLTNQVNFSKIEGDFDLTGENNKVYSVENGSLYSYINNKKILEKFGTKSVNEYSKMVNLSNIDIIQSGAFFCQNIEQIVIYSELKEIGDYAFYGCNNLKEILYEEDYINNVNNIGSWVLNHTNIYKKNRNLVVCGYLVKHDKTKDVLKTSDFSNLKGIASGVFIKNKNLKTLILDTPNIKINSNAFIDTPIEGIFIETVTETGSLGLIIDDDSFVRIGKIEINENGRRTRIFKVYSEYPINFLGVESNQEIEIKVVDTNGNDVTTENINFVAENYQISINEFEYTNNLLLGYSYNNEKKDYRELLEIVDITKVYNSNLYALFSCGEDHSELPSNYTYESIDYELHLLMCQNCDYSIKENHDGSNIENSNNQFDRFTCAKCGYETAHIHDYYEEFKEINGIIQHEKTCNICSYHFICSYEMNVEVQGNNHIVSCGECNSEIIYENHNYYTIDYENFDILVCIYCEEHICNGVNYYINNTTHSVLCSYCREEKICSHVFNEESEYVNQNSNPDNGYHTSTCLICEETIQLEHYYQIAEDNHTLTCRDCNVVYVLTYPDAWNNYNPDLYHIYYCDMCEVYHTELHDLEYFEDGVSCIDGHYQRCSICQRVDILEEHSFEIKSIGSIGHVDECSICGYQTEIETHTLVAKCSDSSIELHHYECVDCDYYAHIPKEYEIYHEYEHFIICSECNGRQTQNHLEDCYPIDGECHMYTCTICNIAYEMPHYVNGMGEAIYYD